MSRENAETVRAALAAWNAGDMDAVRELYDPDAVVRPPDGWPEPGPYFGREAAMRWFQQVREAWDADVLEWIGDFIDVGDRVAVRFDWRTAGRGADANIVVTGILAVRAGR